MTIEDHARMMWKTWGAGWVLNTVCASCGEFKCCRGKRRAKMLCLECWDQGQR